MKRVFKYARCKKSNKAVVQVLLPGYIFYCKCASCGTKFFPSENREDFDKFKNHFEFFKIKDKLGASVDKHIKMIEENPDKYRVEFF